MVNLKKAISYNNLIIVGLYLLLWLLQTKTGINLIVLPGIVLLLYLPGNLLIKVIPALSLNLGRFGLVAVSIIYSFCFSSVAGLFLQSYFGFNSILQNWFFVVFGLVAIMSARLLPKWERWRKVKILGFNRKQKPPYKAHKSDYWLIFLMTVLIAIPIVINPYAQNADDYLTLIMRSIENNVNLLNTRQLFSSFPNFASLVLGVDIKIVFRVIFVLIYSASTLFLLDYLKQKIHNQKIVFISYLLLFSAPVIPTEINIIRPQTIMLIFTLPVLIISLLSVQQKNLLASVVALFLGVVSFRYHELSLLLVVMSLFAIVANIYHLVVVKKTIKPTHILLFLIIIYPYCRMFNILDVSRIAIIKTAFADWRNITWNWWFLDSYKTVDGYELGWPGLQAVQYYLYNGLILLLVALFLYIIIKKYRLKLPSGFAIPLAYFSIQFFFAEIMPRMGMYFLPNRAWVHVALAVVLLIAMEQEVLKRANNKLLLSTMSVIVLVGICGTFYVAKNNVNEIFPEEIGVASYIDKNLAKNAVILSTQDNKSLVAIYAKRNYGRVDPETLGDTPNNENFGIAVNQVLDSLREERLITRRPSLIIVTQTVIGDKVISETREVGQSALSYTIPASYSGKEPVYLLYSKRKAQGINGSRNYRAKIVDTANYSNYERLGYDTIYQDDHSLLFKIK